MVFLAEGIHFTRDRARATALYPLLLPYQRRNVTVSVVSCLGPMARPLGLLAETLELWGDARAHFEAALEMSLEMRARPHTALASFEYARLLRNRADGNSADSKLAMRLAHDALSIAGHLGMQPLARAAASLLDELGGRTARTARDDRHPALRRIGDFWMIAFAGTTTHLRDTKGVSYIAELIRQTEREVHVLDLIGLPAPTADTSPKVGASARGLNRRMHDTPVGELLDSTARNAYRLRLSRLTAELLAAQASGDPEAALALREEVVALQRELRRAVGLRGRPRRTSLTEKARVNVTRTIRLAITRIAEASPALGTHLARSIRTGTFCSYVPDTTRDDRNIRDRSK